MRNSESETTARSQQFLVDNNEAQALDMKLLFDENKFGDPRFSRAEVWTAVRWIPAFILVVACSVKIYQAPAIIANGGMLSKWWLLLVVVYAEIFLSAIIALSGYWISWVTATVTFASLFVVALASNLLEISCNCLGHSFSPMLVIALDVSALLLCIALKPVSYEGGLPSHAILIGSIAGLRGMALTNYQLLNAESPTSGFFLAEDIVKENWPLDSTRSPQLTPLETGNWLVLIVRNDCKHCHRLIAEFFPDGTPPINFRSALFVAGGAEWPFVFDSLNFEFSPRGIVRWSTSEPFTVTPAAFVVRDGIVVSACDGAETDAFIARLLRTGIEH